MSSAAARIEDAGIPSGQTPPLEMDLKKKIQNMKCSRRDEKFNSEKLSQTDPILKDCPENE